MGSSRPSANSRADPRIVDQRETNDQTLFFLMAISFIHAADIHLDSPLKGLERYENAPVDRIRGATQRAFTRLIDLAIDKAVDFVVISGDLYDGDWRDYNTGLYLVRELGASVTSRFR